jgi:hypothetical protein
LKSFALSLFAVEMAPNLFGYALSCLTRLVLKKNETFYSMLFILGSKEFGIAAAATGTMGLNPVINIPSVFFVVAQMISMPAAVIVIGRFEARKDETAPPNKNH